MSLAWGSTFPLVKSALQDVSPLLFNLLRMALAFAVLGAFNCGSLRGVSRCEVRFGALAGIFLGLGYELQTAGLARTTPTESAFITGMVVVLVPLLSALPRFAPPGSTPPGPAAFLGAAIAFAGLLLLTTHPAMASPTPLPLSATRRDNQLTLVHGLTLGEWLTLGCAFAYSAHLLTLAWAAPVVAARRLGTLQIGFCALFMLVCLPAGGRPAFHLTGRAIAALLVTGLLATAAAFTVQSWAQRFLPASHTALILTMEPVFAWLTSLLFFGERLAARTLGGAALILAGILLAELAPALLRRSPDIPAVV